MRKRSAIIGGLHLAGRRINDQMGAHVAETGRAPHDAPRLSCGRKPNLIMGLTFKEICPDLRNSKVINIIKTLGEYNATVEVYDPWIDVGEEAQHEFGIEVEKVGAAARPLRRGHSRRRPSRVRRNGRGESPRLRPARRAVLFDVKSVFAKSGKRRRL